MTQIDRGRRARQLGSDDRAGSWARHKARRRQVDFVRRAWRVFAVAAVFVAVASTLIILIEPDAFVRGLLVGGLWAAVSVGLIMLTSQLSGAASTNMGALAEQWTASELRPLRPLGWALVNHLFLTQSDIDHVVFRGEAMFAIETKWSGDGWNIDRETRYLSDALEQVKRNARRIGVWHAVKGAGVRYVEPVLFLWGGAPKTKPPLPRIIGGVTVVYGSDAARAWRYDLESRTAMFDEVVHERLWAALDEHIYKRDAQELIENPCLPSLERIYSTALSAFAIGSASLFGSLWVLKMFDSFWKWGFTVALAALLTWWFDRRFRRWRPLIAAWLVGLGVSGIFVAVLLSKVAIAR